MMFKPWGELTWLLSKLTIEKFTLMGCLATEARCAGTYRELVKVDKVHYSKFLEITDPGNTAAHDDLRKLCKDMIDSIALPNDIEQHYLLEPTEKIVNSFKTFVEKSNGNVVLDITTFPKRFFFPLVKLLMKEPLVKNFLVTYTVPEKYVDDNLSDNAQSWAPLPLFSPLDDNEAEIELALIGIGFMPLGLPSFLKDKRDKMETKFLFPFPPGPPYYQRTWDFVNQIEASTRVDSRQIYRLDSKAVPSIFDKIKSIARDKKVILAPYGPKTMSLAMCLYGIINDSAVYYTQPTSYNPNYSNGCGVSHAYLIKLDGDSLYK
jgi:hypothetical protein